MGAGGGKGAPLHIPIIVPKPPSSSQTKLPAYCTYPDSLNSQNQTPKPSESAWSEPLNHTSTVDAGTGQVSRPGTGQTETLSPRRSLPRSPPSREGQPQKARHQHSQPQTKSPKF